MDELRLPHITGTIVLMAKPLVDLHVTSGALVPVAF